VVTRGARDLIERSRVALAQWLGVPQVPPSGPPPTRQEVRPVTVFRDQPEERAETRESRESSESFERYERYEREEAVSDDVLAGVCSGIALRDLNLVDILLAQLEKMEAKEDDPDTLAELYRLDHLATRLRRNAENLRVLADREASDEPSDATSLVDVVRAAMSPIEHYPRVHIGQVVPLGVVGVGADDVGRLLAELLDNATTQSPPTAPVKVSAHLTEAGSVLVRIEDEGIGLPPDRLDELNRRLAGGPVLDDKAVRHMGLAVVRRLAVRHNVKVWLGARSPHGTTASVLIPASLVCDLPAGASWSGGQTVTYKESSASAQSQDKSQPADNSDNEHAVGSKSGDLAVLDSQVESAPPLWFLSPSDERAAAPIGGTTQNGLPRRVPRSLRDPAGEPTLGASKLPEQPEPEEIDDSAGHAQLLADLGAFTEGEEAALADQRAAEADPGYGEFPPEEFPPEPLTDRPTEEPHQ
jgi:signal transduction histidine kinase